MFNHKLLYMSNLWIFDQKSLVFSLVTRIVLSPFLSLIALLLATCLILFISVPRWHFCILSCLYIYTLSICFSFLVPIELSYPMSLDNRPYIYSYYRVT